MPLCPSCQREVVPPARFCAECGAALTAAGATRSSPDSHPSSHSSSSIHGRFEPGTRLGTRYRVVGLLGRGGMGEVYRADDLELNQSVALKFLPEKVARNPSDLARLRQEVRIARQIAHPNVCRTYDISEAGGQVFVVMEYVDGEDLASVLRRLGRPTPDKALEIARQLCLGLGAAHENGVLHRDLKPANIMIDGRGRVRITDFGLAGTAEELAADPGTSGTPAYMAPERLRGASATAQSDIFELGLVLYELFTGKRATAATPRPDSSRPDSDSAPRTPSSLVAGVDPVVERVILRCLERDPSRRPQSAYAVFGALPGGDPLAAAVAAGETPSPELVANAGVEGSVRPLYAGLLVVVAVAALLGFSAIQTPLFRGIGKSPDLLSVRADEMVARLAGDAPPKYTVDGMRYAPKPDTARAVQFWKRWSPMPYVPSDIHAPRAGLQDPPQAYPGSATILLDLQGRLIALDALRTDSLPAAPPRTADWGAVVLDAAGRDPDHVVAVAPPSAFLARADSVRAWRLSDSTAPETTLAAAALRGRVVRVETFAKGHPLGRLAVVPHDPPATFQMWVEILLLWVMPLLGSIILARHNLRSKRGDLRGAMAIGIGTAVLYLLAHLFSANLGEIGLLSILLGGSAGAPLGHALVHGVTMALAYLAIEPYVRKLWPSVLVSWARLVAGRLRDPIIGRDVLIGVAFGSASTLISLGVQLLERRLGFPTDPPSLNGFLLETMTHPPSLLANVCMALGVATLRATLFYTILVIFRFVLRRNLLAAIATIVVFLFALSDLSSKALALDLLAGALIWTTGMMMALRFGYVATLVSLFTGLFVESQAFSLDFSSWVAPQTTFGWAIVLALVGYGFLTSVAGHSLFRDPLSDPVATAVRPKGAP